MSASEDLLPDRPSRSAIWSRARRWIDRTSSGWGLAVSGALALVIGGLVVLLVGISPLDAYGAIWQGSFGSTTAIGETVIRFVPIVTIALATIPALKAGLFPVGAQGQLAMGALCAGLMALAHPLPGPYTILLSAAAGASGGGLWAALPAVLRAYMGVNETLSTLAFNFIAGSVLVWMLNGPAKGVGANLPQTAVTATDTWLPLILPATRAHLGLVLVLVAAVALWASQHTALGYRIRLFGANPSLARAAGVRPARIVLLTILIAGLGAGLAGWMQVAGVDRAVYASVARDVGFTGVLVAVLAGLRVSGTLIAGAFFAALASGGDYMQIFAGVSSQLIIAIQGLAIVIASAGLIRSRSSQ